MKGSIEMTTESPVLRWAKQIQALSQSGLAYCKDPYDQGRYEALRDLSVEMMSELSGEEELKIVKEAFSFEQGYATPKVGVRAVVVKEDRWLMVQETDDKCWCLPGGWSDVGDTPRSTVEKEVFEETGFKINVDRLLAVFDRKCHPQPSSLYDIYTLVFLCSIVSGEAQTSIETDAVDFFSPEHLPPLSLQRMTKSQVNIIQNQIKDETLPPYFD